jgi:hypothetical protein
MGAFKSRSDYFKSLAKNNKRIAHEVEVEGEIRNSYHRMNDEDELLAYQLGTFSLRCSHGI